MVRHWLHSHAEQWNDHSLAFTLLLGNRLHPRRRFLHRSHFLGPFNAPPLADFLARNNRETIGDRPRFTGATHAPFRPYGESLDRSHAPRGNVALDALRRSMPGPARQHISAADQEPDAERPRMACPCRAWVRSRRASATRPDPPYKTRRP